MSRPDISVIIVNWRVRDLLEKCLFSIEKYGRNANIEVLVVDNDSRDGTSEMIMVEHSYVRMIALPKNLGFATANNMAFEIAKGRYMLLLNPDTEITENFFEEILAYMEEHPAVGIVGPKIFNTDGSTQMSVRKFPDLWSQILIMLKLKNILIDNKPLNNYLEADFDYTKEQSVQQVMGAAMMIREEVLEEVGYLDEGFFIWFEEVDFCKRAREAGFEVKYYPKAKIIHTGGASFDQALALRKQIIFDKSLLYYFWKHKPLYQWLAILLITPINILLTILYVIFIKNKNKYKQYVA